MLLLQAGFMLSRLPEKSVEALTDSRANCSSRSLLESKANSLWRNSSSIQTSNNSSQVKNQDLCGQN